MPQTERNLAQKTSGQLKICSIFYLVQDVQNLFSWEVFYHYKSVKFAQFKNFWTWLKSIQLRVPFSLRAFSMRPNSIIDFRFIIDFRKIRKIQILPKMYYKVLKPQNPIIWWNNLQTSLVLESLLFPTN